jgi:hypothetical protein
MSPNDIYRLLGATPNYPTKEEIINPVVTFKTATKQAVKTWRENVWKLAKGQDDAARFTALTSLVYALNAVYGQTVALTTDLTLPSSCYTPGTNTIILNKPSIITTLHEYAHALFGTSEKKACRWSVQLFAKIWPKSFARLEWNGHTLIKPDEARLAGAVDNAEPTAAVATDPN